MSEQSITKQIAREFYNVTYGAKLNFASLDICEKLPTVINSLSLFLGVLGLGFASLNNTALSAFLLIVGIIGLMLKPRELQKQSYLDAGKSLTAISKELELLHSNVDVNNPQSVSEAKKDLIILQRRHNELSQPVPVFLSSWYAHYKLFSEHNTKWMNLELDLDYKDKIPLSFRGTIFVIFIWGLIYIDPYCFFSKTWTWVKEPCPNGCYMESKDIKNKPVESKL
ncbi:SLATT domain-containing protein [Photobacterium leiognathi]|uniref:SLATT domain-containing protein n=1 Tax=Photobacterium leiognathi TaxID=553611 RepID=UPI0029824AB5|nr:SLATT domain-containing protein [Photobacterium leiognathi]